MTMTQRVRDLFKQRFEENGISTEGLRVGGFVDVGIECKIPLTWLFKQKLDIDEKFKVDNIYFDVIRELEIDDKYSADFDWIWITSDASTVTSKNLEVY